MLTSGNERKEKKMTKLKCMLCGNEKKFRIRGTVTVIFEAEDDLSGKGVIEELDLPDNQDELPHSHNYTAISCLGDRHFDECGEEVDITTPKEEAEKIISGAYEYLKSLSKTTPST